VLTAIFINACPTIHILIPIAKYFAKSLSVLFAIVKPRIAIMKYAKTIKIIRIKPSSSEDAAKIKSSDA